MTTVLRTRNLRFKINTNDHNPPHVHVEGGGASIRINLLTLEIMDFETEFSTATVRMIVNFVMINREILLEKWVEIHGENN